jgi:hypothetical protein
MYKESAGTLQNPVGRGIGNSKEKDPQKCKRTSHKCEIGNNNVLGKSLGVNRSTRPDLGLSIPHYDAKGLIANCYHL